jgi:L-galactose dehydrogenase
MHYRILGRTGLRVSLLSLGSGGPNRLGQRSGLLYPHIERLIHRSIDLGINFFDTSPTYGDSETILGRVLREASRHSYFIATKFSPIKKETICTPEQFTVSVETSLKRLRVETIDLMQFHRLSVGSYRKVIDRLLPTAEILQKQGKFRFLGITESTSEDCHHDMLSMALTDDIFDTIMVGYNLMNTTAELDLLPICRHKSVGVICSVAVRPLLRRPDYVKKKIDDLKVLGVTVREDLPTYNPLGRLIDKEETLSLPAIGYKYVAAHPDITTVLTGTTNISHLEENACAILSPSLP